ncbi:MAG: META domain-containing protein [Mucinivorans sp.]
MRTKILTSLSISLLCVLLSSCCACRQGSPVVGNLENAVWRVIEIGGKEFPKSGISLTFNAQDKTIYGAAPCNNFFAAYTLSKDKKQNINIHNVGASMRMCPESEMVAETALTRALTSVVLLKIEGSNLLMVDAQGQLVAIATCKE